MPLRCLPLPVRHSHVTVTVETETVERIEERLDPGETVAHWMRDAVELRLDGDQTAEDGRDGRDGGSDGDGGGDRDREDAPGPVYEFVDDCAI